MRSIRPNSNPSSHGPAFSLTTHSFTRIHSGADRSQVKTSFSLCSFKKVSSSWPGTTRPRVMRSRCFRRCVLRNLWGRMIVSIRISVERQGRNRRGSDASSSSSFFFCWSKGLSRCSFCKRPTMSVPVPVSYDRRWKQGKVLDLPCWVVSREPALGNAVPPLRQRMMSDILSKTESVLKSWLQWRGVGLTFSITWQ